MLQVARLAPLLLADATPVLTSFFEGELNEDGGGRDRSGTSDLYYTAFVLEGLMALRADLPKERVRNYLRDFGAGDDLDLVHKACLVRCWAALGEGWPSPDFTSSLTAELAKHRSGDGCYAGTQGASSGTLYYAFLVLGMFQDMHVTMPDPRALGESLAGLRAQDGAYANAADLRWGTTPSTAAAAAVLLQLDMPVPPEVAPWLLAQQHPKGGFKAMPEAPLPDLLSTATALHALHGLQQDIGPAHGPALDFIDTLWTGRAFCGHWADDIVDCEYSFYALLALGHLSGGE